MTDQELCNLIASVWLANGGDAEGFEWCWGRIRDAIKKEEEKE